MPDACTLLRRNWFIRDGVRADFVTQASSPLAAVEFNGGNAQRQRPHSHGSGRWTSGGTCAPNPCLNPVLGCCDCTVAPQSACPGTWIAWKIHCAPPACQIATGSGTCCTLNGSCTITMSQTCAGSFGTTLSCSAPPCVLAFGACCSGASCSVVALSACSASTSRFAGANTACNGVGNTSSPCCYADFNTTNGTSVQDIFDYLTAWFASDSQANTDGTGGVTVNDIFTFLAAWFAGCA